MSVANVKSYWSSGGLVFKPATVAQSPSILLQVGDTNGVSVASGVTGIYGWIKQKTTALTGTARGIRANARCLVTSASGTLRGGEILAGNGTSAVDVDGVSVGTMIGLYCGIAGCPAASEVTVTTGKGLQVICDVNQEFVAFTTLYGAHILFNTDAGGDMSAITTGYGLAIENEAVGGAGGAGTGEDLTAAIYIGAKNMSGGKVGFTNAIAFSADGDGSCGATKLTGSEAGSGNRLKIKVLAGTATYYLMAWATIS